MHLPDPHVVQDMSGNVRSWSASSTSHPSTVLGSTSNTRAVPRMPNTISLKLECMSGLRQISITCQRCDRVSRVAAHNACPMLLQGGQARLEPSIQDVDSAF